MLTDRQFFDVKEQMQRGNFIDAVEKVYFSCLGKGSKAAAWGALQDFCGICAQFNIDIPDKGEWAGFGARPDAEAWLEQAKAFFSKKEKIYLFYWEKDKPMPKVAAQYYRMWKDDFGFAVMACNNEVLLANRKFKDIQHLLGEHGEIKEI